MTDMPEYIDRKALQEMLNAKAEMALGTPKQVFYAVAKMVELLPAADVAPVVHGEWVEIKGMAPPEYHGKHKCSVCGEMALCKKMHEVLSEYCPHCGAKMDGGNYEP